MPQTPEGRLSFFELQKLRRFSTPSVFNGWEQVASIETSREGFNLEPTTDFTPHQLPLVGYAVTVVIEPSNKDHLANKNAWTEYREYVTNMPGPKVVVVQDLDKPIAYGSMWGENQATMHRAWGCVGTITDGGVRDLDEMQLSGYHVLARTTCVGHGYGIPVRWNCPVEVFGCPVQPGQLIHGDKHGFLAIPQADEARLLEATKYMDDAEADSISSYIHSTIGAFAPQALDIINEGRVKYSEIVKKFKERDGEF